jgi:ferric-dicitrate binding protein FerR (iron transport regulator)
MIETGLGQAFRNLPRVDYRRLNVDNATRENYMTDRGASRRNNQLGGAGRVAQVLSIGPSKIYLIRLTNQQVVASINIQPGNRNYVLLPGGTMIAMNSPSDLMQALRNNNLAEVRNYIVREYVANNPHHLDEVREALRRHISETKNQ